MNEIQRQPDQAKAAAAPLTPEKAARIREYIRSNMAALEAHPVTAAYKRGAFKKYCEVTLAETPNMPAGEASLIQGFEQGYWQTHKGEAVFNIMAMGYIKLPEPASRTKELGVSRMEEVTSERGWGLMENLSVRAHPFRGQYLNKEFLWREGLEPKYKIDIEGRTVWFASNPYNLGQGRIAVVGYVQEGQNLIARTYYRSNSQGVWRYLPNYLMQDNQIQWYGKSHGEESITVPIALQKALAEMSKPDKKILNVSNPELAFAGTAREIRRANERNEPITHFIEVAADPVQVGGNFYRGYDRRRIPPERLGFIDNRQKPDFSRAVERWQQTTQLYGTIEVEVFASRDKSLQYMFCRDAKGRAWIGGAENKSKIKTTGVREEWVNLGDLATPAYEYSSQCEGYGSSRNSKGEYLDMYEYYISKIPIIQEYLATKQKTRR